MGNILRFKARPPKRVTVVVPRGATPTQVKILVFEKLHSPEDAEILKRKPPAPSIWSI